MEELERRPLDYSEGQAQAPEREEMDTDGHTMETGRPNNVRVEDEDEEEFSPDEFEHAMDTGRPNDVRIEDEDDKFGPDEFEHAMDTGRPKDVKKGKQATRPLDDDEEDFGLDDFENDSGNDDNVSDIVSLVLENRVIRLSVR